MSIREQGSCMRLFNYFKQHERFCALARKYMHITELQRAPCLLCPMQFLSNVVIPAHYRQLSSLDSFAIQNVMQHSAISRHAIFHSPYIACALRGCKKLTRGQAQQTATCLGAKPSLSKSTNRDGVFHVSVAGVFIRINILPIYIYWYVLQSAPKILHQRVPLILVESFVVVLPRLMVCLSFMSRKFTIN